MTGIVVNEKPQVSREYRDKLRRELYYCEKYGAASHLARTSDQSDLEPEQVERYLCSLLGRIDHVLQIDPHNAYFKQACATIRSMME